jgi:conjugal transfer mating pair stabilization protein TraG
MNWDTGQLFEILAVGDGFFMFRVLQAVSMMWSSGIFASLGALGLLLGLLMVGAQGVASGGQKMDLGSLFTGFILWAILFGGGASVQVTEVGFTRPGSGGTQSYVIDDVPFGVAAAGWLVSNVGKEMTETMEQAFGLVTEPTSVLKTGHGRSLEWLAAVRMARNMNVGTGDSQFAVMRANLISYLRYCSSQAVVRDPARATTMTYAADPFDANTGFGFESGWVTTDWWDYNAGAKPTLRSPAPTCTAALALLRGYWQNGGGAFGDFATTVARPMGYSGSGAPAAQAAEATAALNMSLDNAQKYMVGSMIAGLWSEALSGSPVLSDEQVANRLMMTQAVEQRATEAAAEESMFRRTMFPLMTFLESTLYICTPFMALAVGLGRAGIGITAKYGLVTLWLALWLPTLAVINMFQITSFQSSFTALTQPFAGGPGSYNIGAVATALHLEDQVLDWLSTGSMLAAATPMISLMFLMGSAYTATSLAGAFKGSDVINEKLPSPDIAESKAAMGRGSFTTHSEAGGTILGGSTPGTFSFGSSRTLNESSGVTAARQLMASYIRDQAGSVGTETAYSIMSGVRGSETNKQEASVAQGRAVTALKSQGVDLSQMTSDGQRMVMSFADAITGNAGLDANLAGGLAKKLGQLAKEKGPEALGKVAGMLGLDLKGGAAIKQEDQVAAVADHMMKLGSSIRAATNSDVSTRAAVTGANVASAESYAAIQGSEVSKVANTDTLRKVGSAAETVGANHAKTDGWNAAVGSNKTLNNDELAAKLGRAGFSPERLMAAAAEVGITRDMLEGGIRANRSSWATTNDQAAAVAVVQAMAGNLPGYTGDAPLGTSQQREALASILTQAGIIGGQDAKTLTNNPSANSNVAPNAQTAGENAQRDVENGSVGVGNRDAVAAGVEGNVAALRTSGGRAAALGQVADMGLPVGAALAGGARGGSIEGPGGQVDAAAFEGHAAPTRAAGAAQQDDLHADGKARMAPGLADHEKQNRAVGGALATMMGRPGSTGGWEVGDVGGFPLTGEQGGWLGGQFGVSGQDNPLVTQAIANAQSGAQTGGTEITPAAATVIGTYIGAKSGGGSVSPEQGEAFTRAKESLTPQETAAVNNIINAIEGRGGSMDPSEIAPSAVAAIAAPIGSSQGAPSPMDFNAAPAPVPMSSYSSATSAGDRIWENVSTNDLRKSPAEYSRAAYNRAFEGMPKQGEDGRPTGAWQEGRDDAERQIRREVETVNGGGERSSGATGDW